MGGDARANVGLPAAAARAAADVAARPVRIGRPAVAAGPRSASGRCVIPPVGGEWRVEVPLREGRLREEQRREEQRREEQNCGVRCLEESPGEK